jgi:phosphatidylserine/phosphatidylglycerophosphate/cardiolipin synthase-like enzyme
MSRPRRLARFGFAVLLGGVAACGGGTVQPAQTSLPPHLCVPCASDADCGGGANRCLDLSQGGVACGVDCSAASCPDGFLCASIAGGGANCIPAAGACPATAPCGGSCPAGWRCDEAANSCVALADAGLTLPDAAPPQDAARDATPPPQDAAPPTVGVSIIVEPSDHALALVNAIRTAQSSVHMTMYLLSSSDVIDALIYAKQAGRDVKVILNQSFPSGGGSNATVYSQLQSAGIAVHWAPSTFTLTHEKCVIVDGHTAWIMTMNATTSAPTGNREYLAVDTDPADVAEAEAIFQADYAGTAITPTGKLVVSPVNSRDRLVALINGAHSTIDLEAEELSDYQIVAALANARGRGVTVKIVLSDETPSSAQSTAVTQLKNAGVQLRSLSTPTIHAKSIVADGVLAYVGSANFTTASLMYNRELGVIFSDAAEVQKVLTTTRGDFNSGTPL